MNENDLKKMIAKARRDGAVEALDAMRALDTQAADGPSGVVGVDGPPVLNSAGQFVMDGANSTLQPFVMQVANDAALDADVFLFNDLYQPDLTTAGTVTLTNTATLTAGPPVTLSAAQFAAAVPVVVATTVQKKPTWLASDYQKYLLALAYLAANPSRLETINLTSSETGTAPILGGLTIAFKEINPFGLNTTNEQTGGAFQYPNDFKQNQVVVPTPWPIDLLHYINVTSDITNSSGATVTIRANCGFSRRFEAFRKIIASQPAGPKGGPSQPRAQQIIQDVASKAISLR
jgi:hypothetical protein